MNKKLAVFGVMMLLLLAGSVAGQEVHDIAVTDVATSSTIIYTGWTLNITVTVQNNGDTSETFIVTAYYDDTVVSLQEVTDLPPGNDTTLIFVWDTTGVPLYVSYDISANASAVDGETNLVDNEFLDGSVTVAMLGDVNGDMAIDILDVMAIFTAFGSTPEDPSWDPLADVNKDGKVNILDCIVIAKNFGQTWP